MDSLRGGVEGGFEKLGLSLGSSIAASRPFKGGIGLSELPEELSVDILSLSLSDSSLNSADLLRRLEWMVNEDARGLERRVSERKAVLGTRRLGRRNRWERIFGSSKVRDEVDATALAEDEGGRAKSEEDVAKDGREVALGMFAARLRGRELAVGEE
jgi:hypothetical protein